MSDDSLCGENSFNNACPTENVEMGRGKSLYSARSLEVTSTATAS